MSKINKLNSGSILSAYAKEFTQKKVVINIGNKDYEVLVDEKFKMTKLKDMIIESLINFKKIEDYTEIERHYYSLFLLVKYFTDIDIAKTEDIIEQKRILNAMQDLGIFEIITNAFNESELKKATDFITNIMEKIPELIKENKNQDEIKEFINIESNKILEEKDEEKIIL